MNTIYLYYILHSVCVTYTRSWMSYYKTKDGIWGVTNSMKWKLLLLCLCCALLSSGAGNIFTHLLIFYKYKFIVVVISRQALVVWLTACPLVLVWSFESVLLPGPYLFQCHFALFFLSIHYYFGFVFFEMCVFVFFFFILDLEIRVNRKFWTA